MINTRLLTAGLLIALALLRVSAITAEEAPTMEPNLEIAKQWWPEMPKKWTMVGWPEHITRFDILHDGSLANYFAFHNANVRPKIPEPFTQFTFIPAGNVSEIQASAYNIAQDYGDVVQGWDDSETPVLFSEWPWHGYLLREQVFAHVPGGQELNKGDEPLFAWVRLSVHYACPGLPLEQNVGFGVKINEFSVNVSMELKHNLNAIGAHPKYPRDLKPESEVYTPEAAWRILEPDGRLRLAIAPGVDCKAVFKSGAPTENDAVLYVQLPPKQGAYVDLLIPMLPTDKATFDKELALGYDGAFKEAEAFWSKTPKTAARFEVPEDSINQAIRRNLQFDQITAEKDPVTGETYILTGALGYGIATWGTPVSMAMAGFLDPLGYHSLIEKYLKVFRDTQGKVMPPGDSFKLHPGYLGVSPRTAIVNWLPDHGAILWVMAQHGLLTGDRKYIEEYTPVIVKACEWIRDARRIKGHGGVEGVMPPAGASDDESRIQNCWTDGWIYKGLTTAVEFLKATNNPRSAEFEAEARDYKATFQKAFRAKAETMPTWTDDQGKEHRMIPFALAKEQDWQFRHLFYLDTGPMHLVFAGLMDADDPLMKDAVAWYREGPPAKLYRPYGDLGHVPSLRHEMSSWEACYSWNVYHSWQLGDRQQFLEGMYSQFAGAMSQQTYTVCESRGGITSIISCVPGLTMARLAVVDDQINPNELHLLRLMPLAWLSGEGSRFENMPTKYGPIDLRAELSGKELQVTFAGRFRAKPSRVVLHIPPVPGLKTITLNGKPIKWDGKAKSVEIR